MSFPAARDPVELAIFQSAFHSIAEEMGAALRRTSFSPNIRERRDYSSAVFDDAGQIIAMGDDMPVHLGSMPMSVRAALDKLTLGPGDVAILNDPYDGGTHLPDITLVMPIFIGAQSTSAAFYVANRAHHADVGGAYPGSMGLCQEICQEGIRIPPVKLVRGGLVDHQLLALILNNVRTPREREGDLTAQIGACRIGVQRVSELVAKYGLERVRANVLRMLNHSETLMREYLAQLPQTESFAEDFLDSDGITTEPVRIAVTLKTRSDSRSLVVDFTGSSPQVAGSLNAVAAITYSATFYVLRCLLPEEASPTAGLMRPVSLLLPERSVVNAQAPAAVAGGNVETSQRITDVLLRAFAAIVPDRIPAASSGTMNNLTIGGVDPRTGQLYTYYETIGGGAGARPNANGISGIHTHMTNSLNTPIEALEYAYPFRVRQYSYRRGSGGPGKYVGGDGLVREIELLAPAQITLLSDRRLHAPYGLAGGGDGMRGRNILIEDGVERELPGKCNFRVNAGAVLRIETPGGGGWGQPTSPGR
ncbi:MAG TPA: hydantoinase B/oxoprolinase family protein [Bryobacteraceae bacterium]|jgi:N-methylhydantoinase B|nr:hydantoinase B/oxoprolinase family protein [Bryobacteraceae bacterium]